MKVVFVSLFLLLSSPHCFCQYDAIQPQGIYSSSFIIDEKPRSITYNMPAAYGRGEAYPLLIVLHPEKSDAATTVKRYGDIIAAKADSAGCIVMYPDAYKGHWNNAPKDSINDVGFINIMSEFFLRQFDCDLGDIKLLGIGSGGNLCYRFNCESVYQPAALATLNADVDKSEFANCRNKKTPPVLTIKNEVVTKTNVSKALDFLFLNHKGK